MAIFDPTEEQQGSVPKPVKKEPVEVNVGYQSATVDDTQHPLQNLIRHVEGYSWTVDYYSQLLGPDDAPQAQSISLDPTLQQYHKINGFEIRVTNPLSYEFIKEHQGNFLEGGGVVYAGTIIPCRGDAFIADVGNGNLAIFNILDVTPTSYMMEKCYEITYRMARDVPGPFEDDLEKKTVKVSHFNRDFMTYGQNPVLSENTVNLKKQLDSHGHGLLDAYLNDFAGNEYRYLLVPGQDRPTYDPFVTEMLMTFLNSSQHALLRKLNYPPMREILALRVETLWDALLAQQPMDTRSLSTRLSTQMTVTDTWTIKNSPYFASLYYSSVQRLLWPTQNAEGISIHPFIGGVETYEPPAPTDPNAEPVRATIYPVTEDDNYVLSQAFYDADRQAQSELELLVTQMLSRERIPEGKLFEICEQAYGWEPVERFYYTPILLVLIQYAVRSL